MRSAKGNLYPVGRSGIGLTSAKWLITGRQVVPRLPMLALNKCNRTWLATTVETDMLYMLSLKSHDLCGIYYVGELSVFIFALQ